GQELAENMWLSSWKSYLIGMPNFPQDATFFSRYILATVRGVDERFNFGLDVAFFFRALRAARCVVLCHSVLSQMYVYPMQKTRREDPSKALELAILRNEYEPKLGLLGRLMWTRFQPIVVDIVPLLYHKERRRFLKMERNFFVGKWELYEL